MNTTLPIVPANRTGESVGRWWTSEADGRIVCDLCPRGCRLKPGDRGFCFVRDNRDGRDGAGYLWSQHRLLHRSDREEAAESFSSRDSVLRFGTAGCNLGCKFCQNWDISKSREVARLSEHGDAQAILPTPRRSSEAAAASPSPTTIPVIWAEYAIDTAAACRRLGIKTVAVTAGYITPQARGEFFDAMDAANIDLKAFTEDFYLQADRVASRARARHDSLVCNETDCLGRVDESDHSRCERYA